MDLLISPRRHHWLPLSVQRQGYWEYGFSSVLAIRFTVSRTHLNSKVQIVAASDEDNFWVAEGISNPIRHSAEDISTKEPSLNGTQNYKSVSASPVGDQTQTTENTIDTLKTEGEGEGEDLEAESCPSLEARTPTTTIEHFGLEAYLSDRDATAAEYSEPHDTSVISEELVVEEQGGDPERHLHLQLGPGQHIGRGRYQIIKKLGEGQSSYVWLACLTEKCSVGEVGTNVAIKVCKKGSIYADAVAYEAQTITYLMGGEEDFLAGADRSEGCTGGTIATLIDEFDEAALEDDDDYEDDPNSTIHPCLVFEVHGPPLDKLMSLTTNNGINPRAVRSLMRNIVRIAAQLADKHVIHTDLKPENLLLRNPSTLADPMLTAALQPTVRFVPSTSSTPNITSSTSQMLSKSVNDNSFNLTPRVGGTPAATQLTPRVGGAPSVASSRRMSLSMAGGGDGPHIPMLADGSDPLDVVLIDFGLSYFEPIESRPAVKRRHQSQSNSREGSPYEEYTDAQNSLLEASNYTLGVEIQTREYRAPEIILGRPFNSRTDLWSVACIAYELVTGRYLFDPKMPLAQQEDADGVDLKYLEDAQHLRLVSYTIGALPTIDVGVHEDLYYGEGPTPLFDLALSYLPESTLMSLPPDNDPYALRDLDFEVRPFLGPMESPLFVSFLMKCLKWNPNDRLEAAVLLDHPWLAIRPGEGVAYD